MVRRSEDTEDVRRGARSDRRRRHPLAQLAGAVALVASLAMAGSVTGTSPVAAAAGGPSGVQGAPGPALTVTPTADLVDDQTVSVVVMGVSPGSILVVVECGPTAISLLEQGRSPADGCETRHNGLMPVDADGMAAATIRPQAVMTTASGAGDCRAVQCFIAVESYYSTGSSVTLLQNISFSASACAAAGSCTTPDDAWDPSLGGPPPPAPRSQTVTSATTPSAGPDAIRLHGDRSATPGHPVAFPVTAGQAGDLQGPGTVTGPYTSAFPSPVVPSAPVAGDGLLRIALSAPRTSWGAARPSSTVVDVTLTDTTTSTAVSTQQFVLFDGAKRFVYAGFTGPVTTADSYQVTVSAEASHADGGLSWPSGSATPTASVTDAQLEVVDPTNPQYLAMAYAPVMYGRSTSALHDVPMIVDATATPVTGGTKLSYTVIWSHEDAGTGFVPFLEWTTWGRMTDIENAISFTVAADGSVTGASYLWGGEPATGYPDSEGALQEVNVPFDGQWDGHHPILRDATGNDDFSDAGTTAFRFQLAPVPGPGAGQARESVMDAHPFTYRISGQEVDRWYGDVSKDPRSFEPGDARQYATVDLETSGTGVSSIAVELQLAGDPTWYAGDLHSGYPSSETGHDRTVVKLPKGWQSQAITGVRVQAYPASAASSVVVDSLEVLALQQNWQLTTESIPRPVVIGGITAIPTSLTVVPTRGTDQSVRPGGPVGSLRATVRDALGERLAGVPVTFSTGTSGVLFASCRCSSVTALTGPRGSATSGRGTAPATAGQVTLTATVDDAGAPPATFHVDISGSPVRAR